VGENLLVVPVGVVDQLFLLGLLVLVLLDQLFGLLVLLCQLGELPVELLVLVVWWVIVCGLLGLG
jgi:hypothetical protein